MFVYIKKYFISSKQQLDTTVESSLFKLIFAYELIKK